MLPAPFLLFVRHARLVSNELEATLTQIDQGSEKTKYFVAGGMSHVALATPSAALKTWLGQMGSDAPAWKSERH